MTDIFRGPLIIKTWHPDPNAWWRSWTWSYNLNLVAKDQMVVGEQFTDRPPLGPQQPERTWLLNLLQSTLTPVVFPTGVEVFDRPPGPDEPYPRQLRVWAWSYNLNLIAQDRMVTGEQIWELPPRPYQRPADLITWTWSYNRNLIGKDSMVVGQQFTELPPRDPREVRSWIWNYNLNLIGQDQFPSGETIYERPILPVVWYQHWGLNLLQTTLTPVVFPVGAIYSDRPPTITWYQSWTLNLLQGTLTPTVPLPDGKFFYDLPIQPVGRNRSLRTWIWSYNINLIGQDNLPTGEIVTDLPPRAYPRIEQTWTWRYNLNLIGKDLMLVGEQVFDLPPRPPFEPATRTWTFQYNPNLVGQDQLPTGEISSDLPPRDYPERYRTWVWQLNLNLLGKDKLTVGEQAYDLWAKAPQRPSNLDTWVFQYNLNLIGQDQLPPGEQFFERPPPIGWYREWILNLQQTTLRPVPFNQFDWPLPTPPSKPGQTWVQNLLETTLKPVTTPFSQTDWPLPVPAFRLPQSWTFQYNLNLIGQDRLPSGEQSYDRPPLGPQQPALGQASFYNLNLIAKDALPIGEQVWERPPVPGWYRDWSQSLLYTLLSPTAAFNQYDWPVPRAPQQPAFGFTASYNLNLIGQDRLPVGENVYDLPPRGVLATDARSWVVNTSLALSASLGTPVGVQVYDLAPRAYPPLPPTITASYNLNLIGQDARLVGKAHYDRPPPVDWRQSWTQSYSLTLIGRDQLPPGTQAFELTPRAHPPQHQQRTWLSSYTLSLIAQDAMIVGEQVYDLAPRGVLPTDFRSFTSGNQIVLLPPTSARTDMEVFIYG